MAEDKRSQKAASKIENDARGQFVQSRRGAKNDGVPSAKPRVITGTDDATFDRDPKVPYRENDSGE
jgi:hypothetical protein